MEVNKRKSYARRLHLENAPIVKKGFKKLTLDCVKIIRFLEEEGPLKRIQIMKLTGIPEGTIQRRLNHLIAIGSITRTGNRYQPGPEPQDRKILRAMKQLRNESFHQLTVDKIASLAGVAPEEAKPIIYSLAPKLRVTIGNEDIKHDFSVIL